MDWAVQVVFVYATVHDIDIICSLSWFSLNNLFCSDFLFTDCHVLWEDWLEMYVENICFLFWICEEADFEVKLWYCWVIFLSEFNVSPELVLCLSSCFILEHVLWRLPLLCRPNSNTPHLSLDKLFNFFEHVDIILMVRFFFRLYTMCLLLIICFISFVIHGNVSLDLAIFWGMWLFMLSWRASVEVSHNSCWFTSVPIVDQPTCDCILKMAWFVNSRKPC